MGHAKVTETTGLLSQKKTAKNSPDRIRKICMQYTVVRFVCSILDINVSLNPDSFYDHCSDFLRENYSFVFSNILRRANHFFF